MSDMDTSKRSHEMLTDAYMAVTGNVSCGFHFYGPFKTSEKAAKWADQNLNESHVHPIHYVKDWGFGDA